MSTNHGTQNAAAFQAMQPRDIPVTDADREAVERWCRERGWLCPPEGAEQAIARARAEERERCIADLRASVKPCDERDQRCGCSKCEFAWEVQAIEDAIRARGEQGGK